jgi:hypothetical protein
MTDVLILKRIPGLKPGQVVPLTARLEQHVAAGNAKIIPNEHGEYAAPPEPRDSQPPVLHMVGTGTAEDVVADDDDDTEDWD